MAEDAKIESYNGPNQDMVEKGYATSYSNRGFWGGGVIGAVVGFFSSMPLLKYFTPEDFKAEFEALKKAGAIEYKVVNIATRGLGTLGLGLIAGLGTAIVAGFRGKKRGREAVEETKQQFAQLQVEAREAKAENKMLKEQMADIKEVAALRSSHSAHGPTSSIQSGNAAPLHDMREEAPGLGM